MKKKILLFILLTNLVLLSGVEKNLKKIIKVDDSIKEIAYENLNTNITYRHGFITEIRFKNDRDQSVKVRTWERDSLKIDLNFEIETTTEKFIKNIEQIDLKLSEKDGVLGLEITPIEKHPEYNEVIKTEGNWKDFFRKFEYTFAMSGEIFLPKDRQLSLKCYNHEIKIKNSEDNIELLGAYNEISLENCKKITQIVNRSGKVNLENIYSNLKIDSKYSDIFLKEIFGKLKLESRSANINLNRIEGDVNCNASYSNIKADSISGLFEIENRSGEIVLKNCGQYSIDSPYSEITIKESQSSFNNENKISAKNSRIQIENAIGNNFIEAPYSNIFLKKTNGDLNAEGRSCDFSLENHKGDIRIKSSYSTINFKEIESNKISIKNRNAEIFMSLINNPQVIFMKSTFTDINLKFLAEENYKGSFSITNENGKIFTNLIEAESGREQLIHRDWESGSYITIDNRSGVIKLMK